MASIDFIRSNPITEGMQDAARTAQAQARIEQIRSQQDSDAAMGRVARGIVEAEQANPGMTAQDRVGNLRRAAAAPGLSGEAAMGLLERAQGQERQLQQDQASREEREARRKDKHVANMATYLKLGATELAKAAAKEAGLIVPDTFWTNHDAQRKLIEQLEIDQKRASIASSRASAGASQALAESRRAPQIDEYQDDQGRTVRVDRATGRSTFVVGPDGQPLKQRQTGRPDYRDYDLKDAEGKPAGFERIYADGRRERFQAPDGTQYAPQAGGAGGRPLDREVRFRMLVESGVDENEARRIATGVAMTPGQIAQFRDRAMKRVQTPDPTTGRLQFRTPAEQQAEVDRQVKIITGGTDQPVTQQQPQQQQDTGAIPMVNGLPAPRTLDEAESLPIGSRFVAPDGKIKVRR